jgi:hypothetical protein
VNGTAYELLERCRSAGLKLMVEGDALHVDFNGEPSAGFGTDLAAQA